MSRPSREKNREQRHSESSATLAAAPIEVLVTAAGPDAGGATIGGVPVAVADGEDVQQAVLSHLHRIALATCQPVHATIHDERHGCVVPLQVNPDGSSHLTGAPAPAQAPAPQSLREPTARPAPPRPYEPSAVSGVSSHEPLAASEAPPRAAASAPSGQSYEPQAAPEMPPPPIPAAPPVPVDSPALVAPPADLAPFDQPTAPARSHPDRPTHLLRPTAEPVTDAAPNFPLRALSEQVEDRAPGTVAPPTGVFGPPPVMDAVPPMDAASPMDVVPPRPAPEADGAVWPPAPGAVPQDAPTPRLTPLRSSPSSSPDTSRIRRPLIPVLDPDPEPRPTSATPTPARGFDAVAEAVLGDEPPTVPGFLMEPMVRVNEAVRAGRIAEAAELAEDVVREASAALGVEHPEVLKVRELTAYIAYLAGEPVRAFRISLDLARIHRHTRDAEGAYGNVQSAASAWRAVRDPELGLALGHDLIGLWTELAAEDGPAAEDIERLESARTRMGRLTERARKSAQQPSS